MSTLISHLDISPSRRIDRARFRAVSLVQLLALWQRRMRGRAALARFREQELRDIGRSPSEAQSECAKLFWQG
jgi:uncharacterized protein YjiS (DUF1127 family)